MKKEKLIKSIKNIDDDLICEAMNRRSEETPPIEEKAEIISVSGGKRRSGQLWKYPVTAAALLGVIGGAVFVANNRGVIDNIDATVSGEPSESIADTVNPEISENVSKTVDEAISTIVSKEPDPIVPIKINGGGHGIGIFVDSYPEIPEPDFDKEFFCEMSLEDLLEYYGIYNNILELIKNNEIIEITDKSVLHGIYTFPDGNIYDINTFTFKLTQHSMIAGNQFTLTIGKKSTFGHEYYKYYKEAGILPGGEYTAFYNEKKEILFSVHNIEGVTFMLSGTVDEIADIDGIDNPDEKEWYIQHDKKNRELCDGLPAATDLFVQARFMCLKRRSKSFDELNLDKYI